MKSPQAFITGTRTAPKTPNAWRLVDVEIDKQQAVFNCRLNKEKLRRQLHRERCYLLRTNLTERDPGKLKPKAKSKTKNV